MINNWELIGNLGPIKYNNAAQGGIVIQKRVLKPGTKNEYEYKPVWYNYTIFGTLAKNFSGIAKKGMLVRLTGECVIEEYEGKTYTKMHVRDFKLLYTPQSREPKEEQLPIEETNIRNTNNEDELPF